MTTLLDVVNLNVLGATGTAGVAVAVAVLVELEATVAILVGAEGVGLVDLGGVGKLAVGLPVVGERRVLVRCLFVEEEREGY